MIWTIENIAELERLYAAGKSYAEIAAALGCEIYQIQYQIKRNGLRDKYKRSAKYRKKKQPKQKKARPVRINPNPVTEATCSLVCTSHYEGDDMRVIAHMLNRPMTQIMQILARCKRDGYYDWINDKEE